MTEQGCAEPAWRQCGVHGDLVLEKRQSRSVSGGDGTGSMSQEIRVRHVDGAVILQREVTIRWQHFGQINAAFSDDGLAVVVTATGGRDRVWPLP